MSGSKVPVGGAGSDSAAAAVADMLWSLVPWSRGERWSGEECGEGEGREAEGGGTR